MSLFYNWIIRVAVYALTLTLCTTNALNAQIYSQLPDGVSQENPEMIASGRRILDSLLENSNSKSSFTYPPGWDLPVNTGNITGVIVAKEANPNINGIRLKQNDAIGGFFLNSQGQYQCAGAIYWPDTAGIVFSLFGDDPDTPIKEGFAYGETIHYKLFSFDMMAEFDVDEIQLSPEFMMSNKWYPLSLIKLIKMNCYEDVIVRATANQELFCDQGTASLNAEIITGTGNITYSWTSIPPGFTSSLKNPTVAVTEDKVFKVKATLGTATATSFVSICVSKSPFVNIGEDIETCGINQILLSPVVENVSDVFWTTSGDGTFENSNATNTIYFFGNGDFNNNGVTLSIAGQPMAPCSAQATDQMEITLFPSPIVVVPQDLFTCQGVPVDIEATASNVSGLLWQTDGNGTFSNPTSLATTYTPGTYGNTHSTVRLTLTGYGQQPCDASIVKETILQINKPAICYAGDDATICANETFTTCATASYQNTVKWYTSGDGTFVDDTKLITKYTPGPNDKINGTPRLTVYVTSIEPCVGAKFDRMDLWVNPDPVVNAGSDIVILTTGTVPLNATASSYSSLQWSTTGDGTFANAQQAVTSYSPGAGDLNNKSVFLTLKANPLAPCTTPAQDGLLVSFVEGAVANAGPDVTICGATKVTLQGSATNYVSVLWSTSGTGTFANPNQLSTQYTPGTADVTAGQVVLSLTPFGQPPFVNGVPDQKIVTILQPAVVNQITAPASVCQTQPIILSATASNYGSLLWTSAGDGAFSNPSILNPQYTPGPQDIANSSVKLTLTASSVSPCSGNSVMNKTIQIKRAPLANAGNDVTACQGTQVAISGSVQYNSSVIWTTSGDGNFSNAQQLATSYNPGNNDIQLGTVTLTLTAGAQQPCTVSAADQLVITIFKNPASNAGNDIASCERQPIAISGTASNYNSTVWETSGNGTFTNKNARSTTYNPSNQDVAAGSVTLTLRALPKSPCLIAAEDSRLVTLSTSPVVNAGSNITVCEQQNVQLIGTATNAQSVIWSTNGNGTFANASALSTTYTPGNLDIANGQVVLQLTAISGNTCSNASGSLMVSITKNPVVNAGNNGQVALGGSFTINGASATNASSILWTTPNGAGTIQNANTFTATYIPLEADYNTQVVILKLTALPINPCVTAAFDEMNLTITSGCENATAFAGPDKEICYNPGTPVALSSATAQNYASLLWSTQGDGTFSNSGLLHPTYTPGAGDAQNGFVILNLMAKANGVCDNATDQIKIVLLTPATVNAGVDASICVNQSFNTNAVATNAETLQWTTSGDGSFANPNQRQTQYFPGIADKTAGSVQLCLSADGIQSCPIVNDCMTLHLQPMPSLYAGNDLTLIIGDLYNTNAAQANNYSSLLWSTSGDGTFANPTALSTIYTPGQVDYQNKVVTLKLIANAQNPCAGNIQDEMVITFVNGCEDAVANAGPDRTVCETSNVTLSGTAQNQTSVLWTTSGNGTFNAATNINATYYPGTADIATGNVQLCLTAFANGECNDATDCLNITFGKAPIANAGSDITTCATSAFVNLIGQAQNHTSFQWVTLGTGYFTPPTSRTPKYFFSGLDKQLGQVKVVFKATNATCGTASDTLIITINNPPMVYAGGNASICASQPFTNANASATNYTALLWSTSGDGTFDNASLLHATYYAGTNDATTGTVTLILSAAGLSGCQQAQSSFTLTLIPSATANAGNDMTICATQTAALAGQASNYESLIWQTTGDGTFANAAVLSTTYFPGTADRAMGYVKVSLTAFSSGNCGDATSELQINIIPMPTANAGNNQQICEGSQVQLSATATHHTGIIWNTSGDGIFNNPFALNAKYTPGTADIAAGNVTLCLTAKGATPCGNATDCTDINIIALPAVSAGINAAVCQGGSLLLTGIAAHHSSLLWTTEGDGTFTNALGVNAQYHPGSQDIAAGSVEICLNAQGFSGCGNASDCLLLTIEKNPLVFAGNDATIDQGNSYKTLLANAQHYSWIEWSTSGSGTFTNPLQPVTIYTPSQADYQNQPVTLTLNALPKNPCTLPVSDAMLLTINILDLMVDAGEDAVVCSGQNIQLAAQAINYTTLQWSTSGNGTFSNTSVLNPIYTPCSGEIHNGQATLCLKAFGSDGQSISDYITLTFQKPPLAFAGSDNTVPISEGYHLKQSFAENYETIQWYTSNGMGMFDSESILHPTYYASPMDIMQGQIFLFIAVSPMTPCQIADEDMVAINFVGECADAMAFAGADMHLCKELETSSVLLAEAVAKNFSSVLWTSNGTGTFDYNYISRPLYYPSEQDLDNGSVTLTMSVAAYETCSSASDQIVLYFDDMPEVWAGDDMTVCSTVGLPLFGTASNYASLTWTTSGDGVFTDGDTPQPIYYPGSGDASAPSVTLCLNAQGYGECLPASDCMKVTFVPVPQVNAGTNAAVCAGNSYVLQGTAANYASVHWTSEGDGTFDNATLLQAKYTPGTTDLLYGSVELCLTAQGLMGCPENISCTTLEIRYNPTADAGQDAMAVTGQQYLIDDATAQYQSAVQWITNGSGVFGNANQLSTTYTPSVLDEQQQQVILTLQAAPFNPCTVAASDQKQLTITPNCQNAIANAGSDITFCRGGSIALSATAQNQTGVLWTTNGDGTFATPTNINTTYLPGTTDLTNGNVQLCLTAFASGDCSDATDCLTITFGTPPIVNAGDDITACTTNSFVQLNGQVQNYQSFQWVTLGTGYFSPPTSRTPKYFFSGLDKQLGEVKLIFKATNATCGTTYDTLTVTINNAPVAFAGNNATICASEPFINTNAFATDYSALLWSTNGDGTFDNASMLHATYYAGTNDATAGMVTLTLSAAGLSGCQQAQSSFTLTLIPSAYANAGNNLTLCTTENATLAGQAANYESLLWETTGNGTFANAAVLNTTYFPGTADRALGYVKVSLTAFSSGNCGDATSELQINIIPMPTVNAGNNQQICSGKQVQLSATASNYASLTWSTNGDGSFNNTSALNAKYTPGAADKLNGNVGLCLTAQGLMGCPESTSCISISIQKNPIANAGQDAVAITGKQFQINDATAQYHSAVQWITNGSGVFGNANQLSTTYTPSVLDEQQQQVILTLQAAPLNPCTVAASDQKQLTIMPDCLDAIADAGLDLTVCYSGAIALNATAQNQTGVVWNTSGDGTFNAVSNINTSYFPGNADRANGSVQLCLTAFAGGNCNSATDCLEIIFGNSPVIDAGENTTLCVTEDFIQLAGSAVNGGNIQWTTTGEGFFAPPNQLVTKYFFSFYEKIGGHVDLILSATNSPCETVYDTLCIIFNPQPIVYAGEDATICGNEEYMLFEAFAADYQSLEWTTSGDGTFEDAGFLNTIYYPGAADIIAEAVELQLIANPLAGCTSDASSFILTLIPSAYANAGNNLTICETGTAALTGQAADYESLLWTTKGDGVFTNAVALNTTYLPGAGDISLGKAKISLTAFSSGNCGDAISEMIINILPVPTANAGNDQQICAGEQVQLLATATNFASVVWSTSGDGVFNNPSALNAIYTPGAADLQNGFAELCLKAISAAACADALSCIEVEIQESPIANAGADAVVCQNQTYQLSATASNNNGVLWSTAGDGSFNNATLPNAIYTPGANDISQGSVVLSLKAFANGVCADAIDAMSLTIQPAPVINAGADFTICESNFAQLIATGTNYSNIGWATSGDGTFNNASLTNAIYFPGSQDRIKGFANLTITAQGISPCTQISDGLKITLQPNPEIAALQNAAICPDQTITVVAVATHYQAVFWTTMGDGTFATPQALSSVYYPGANDVAAGGADLCITATGRYACENTMACMRLTIISLPEVAAGNDVTICNTDNVALSAQASNYESLQWTTTGDGTFSSTTALVSIYTPGNNDLAEGSAKVCLNAFAENGCGQSQDCLIITLQTPPTVDAGEDQTLCVNQYASISGASVNASSVLWSTDGDGTFANPSAHTTTYYPGTTDNANLGVKLCLTAQSGGSCEPLSDYLMITLQPGPTVFAGNDTTVCANQNVPLQATATGHSSVFWNTSGTGSFSNPQILNPTYFPSQVDKNNGSVQLTIKATGSNGCGFVTDAVAVSLIPVPVANAGVDATTCQTTPYLLNGSVQNTVSMQWTTNGDGTFANPAAAITTYTSGTNDGVVGYVNLCLQTIGQSPCVATDDCMKLTIMKSPTVYPGTDIVSCADNQVSLQGQATNQLSVLWSTNGDGTFANAGALSTKYFPGTADVNNRGTELCLTAFGKANCEMVSECLMLSIVPLPLAYAGSDAIIEQGESYQLLDATAENHSQVIWHTSGTGVFINANELNTIYTPSNYDVGLGSVVLKLEAMPENPCAISIAHDMLLTIVTTGCIDAEANAGADLTICTGQSILMENAGINFAESILWSTTGDGTFDDATLQHPTYFPGINDDAIGTVTLCVQAIASPPCQDANDCVKVTILQNAVAYAGGDNTVPFGEPYHIADAWTENASMVQWYTTNGMGMFENPTSANASYIASPFDVYQDTIHLAMAVMSINPCVMDAADELAVKFTPEGDDAQADAGVNIFICGNDSIVALSGSATGYKALQWTTSGDGTFDHPNAGVGKYKLGASDRDADEITLYLQAIAFDDFASAIDSLTITKPVMPMVVAGADKTVCEGGVVETTLASAEDYSNVLWTTNGDGTFANASSILTIYSPGMADAANGQAELTLTAFALAPCTNSISSSFMLTIDPLPAFLSNLPDTNVVIGESIVLNMDVENATGCQWYGPAGMIAGAESPELLIAQASAEDEGYYYFEVFNDCGSATSNVMYLQVYDQQIVMIPAGWSGLSSWIDPGNPSIEAIFDPYLDDFVIARNYSGMYYPQVNVNTLNLWNAQTGYTVNFSDQVSFKISGDINTNRTVAMATGWNYLPVISSCPVNIATLLASYDTKVQVVKEIAGTGVYWPALSINTIGELQPGRAYEIRVAQPFFLTFPECDGLKSSAGAAPLQPKYDTPWNEIHYSPASHSIAIHDDLAAMLQPGDILGAFTTSGICAGAHQINDFGNVIVLFGNDVLTDAADGFAENETIRFEVFRPATGGQFTLEVAYDQTFACHNGQFVSGGVSVITKTSTTAIPTPDATSLVSVYPNPTSGMVYVSGVKSDMQIELRNVNGQVLQTISCRLAEDGENRVAVDLSSFATGVIHMRIYNDSEVIHRKLIVK